MSDLKKLKTNEKKKYFPVIVVLVLFIAGLFYFLSLPSTEVTKGWALVAPRPNKEPLSEEDAKLMKRKAARAFQLGQIEAVLAAHKNLARVVEGYPKDLEAMGMLCMAYEE